MREKLDKALQMWYNIVGWYKKKKKKINYLWSQILYALCDKFLLLLLIQIYNYSYIAAAVLK